MTNTVTATELARNIGDILARVRYRRESFVVERNGRPVARIEPADETAAGTVRDALAAWIAERTNDPGFADDLDRVNAADRPGGRGNSNPPGICRSCRSLGREALPRDRWIESESAAR